MAAIRAAKISIGETVKAEQEIREVENIERKRMFLQALLSEVNDNLLMAEDIFVGYAKIRFSTDIYEQIRLNIDALPADAILPAREAYSAAIRFNSLAEYDQQKISPGAGTLDKRLRDRNEVAKTAFTGLREILETQL